MDVAYVPVVVAQVSGFVTSGYSPASSAHQLQAKEVSCFEATLEPSAQCVQRNTTRMLQLVSDLLDIEKIEAGKWDLKLERIPVSDVLERSIEMIQILADDKKIAITASAGEIEIVADADRLTRVLVNLLSNAIKFSPRASSISLSASESPEWVKIKVSDPGRGIPPDATGKLFDRFQQVDIEDSALHGGSGLGLAICKAILLAVNRVPNTVYGAHQRWLSIDIELDSKSVDARAHRFRRHVDI